MDRKMMLDVAEGKKPAELVFKHSWIVDVFAKRFYIGDIAVQDGIIVGTGDYSGIKEIDCTGKYITPGFINCHCHVESSMAVPDVYAEEEIKWGTTLIITDPHEIANAAGTEGIDYMLSHYKHCPLDYYVQIPSCVPSSPEENSNAVLKADTIKKYVGHKGVLGLGEMMDVSGVLDYNPDVIAKIDEFKDYILDGHAPGLKNKALNAYVLMGIQNDHESGSFEEAMGKLSSGLAVLVREGSACKNLEAILKPVIEQHIATDRFAFCTDDKHLADIAREGTISNCIRMALKLGMPPAEAVSMATYNGARIFGLKGKGAIAPGYAADLVVIDDIEKVSVSEVYKDGKLVVKNHEYVGKSYPRIVVPDTLNGLVNYPKLTLKDLELPDMNVLPVISILPGEVVTKHIEMPKDEAVKELKEGKICKIAVVERYHKTGNVGVGLIKGYGLKNGAIASTVAHDSHNLMLVGDNSEDMLLASEEIKRNGGGIVIVSKGKTVCSLPLPVGGLMSSLPANELNKKIAELLSNLNKLGVNGKLDPLVTLSFMALTAIPEIRITDRGMYDVVNKKLI